MKTQEVKEALSGLLSDIVQFDDKFCEDEIRTWLMGYGREINFFAEGAPRLSARQIKRMRTEQEILNQVMAYAAAVPGIRAVIRTNLMPVRKYLYLYEFYFIVEKIEDYENDDIFEQYFGERILLYRGDRNYPDLLDDMKAHLMVYKDGITLVINAISNNKFRDKYGRKNTENAWISGTFQVLLDKDGLYADVEKTEENLLFYEVPNVKDFEGCCSEFFLGTENLCGICFEKGNPRCYVLSELFGQRRAESHDPLVYLPAKKGACGTGDFGFLFGKISAGRYMGELLQNLCLCGAVFLMERAV